MEARDCHVSQPARKHPQQRVSAAASSCLPGVVERSLNVPWALPSPLPSPSHADNQRSTPSQLAAARAARRVLASSETAAVSPSDAIGAARGQGHFALSGPVAALAGPSEKAALSGDDGRSDSLCGGRLELTPSPRPGGSCRGAALGRTMRSPSGQSQAMLGKPPSTAAHHTWDAAADSSPLINDNYTYTSASAAAARPAAHVVRVDRSVHQQLRECEDATRRRDVQLVPAIVERQFDSELQQIGRQELEASDDITGFTVGEIVERPTESLTQPQPRRRQELPAQLETQQKGLQLQQALQQTSVDACVPRGPLRETAQAGSARQRGAAAAAAAGRFSTAAAACAGGSGFVSTASHASLDRRSCSTFVESDAALGAPVGFPRPMHRAVLRQQLERLLTQEGEEPHGRHDCAGEQEKVREDSCGERPQQPSGTSVMRGWVSASNEERHTVESTQTTACPDEAESGLEHATSVRRWCRRADDDRASMEAEAAELLRAMQPPEIAAARQELLDRFGPKRYAVLQRRALRRAAAQQQTAPPPQPAGLAAATEYTSTGGCEGSHQGLRLESASVPVGESLQGNCPTSFFAVLSDDASRCRRPDSDMRSSANAFRPPADSITAAPSAYVSFASGRRRHVTTRDSALSAGEAVSDDVGEESAATCGRPTILPGAAGARLDVHEIAKLRWTDPLGPEDWQSGPFAYCEGVAGGEGMADDKLASKQYRELRDALSAPVAAGKPNRQLDCAGCPTAFANVHVRLEQLRFDFDGRLRSDLLRLQDAVSAAVAGVRAAKMRRRRQRDAVGRRNTQMQPPQGSSQQVSTQRSPNRYTEQDGQEERSAAFRTGKSQQGVQGEETTASAFNENRRRSGPATSVKEMKRGQNLRNSGKSTGAADTEKVDEDEATAAVGRNSVQGGLEDFSGENTDDSDPLEFYRGLHHHGDAAALPGYTVCELLHLAQSSNHAQAALALQTLAAVIRSSRTLFSCPSIAAASAFAASVRRWAGQQQYTVQPKHQVPPPELRQCERHTQLQKLQQGKGPTYEEGQLSRQHQREHTALQERGGIREQHELRAVGVGGEQDDTEDVGTLTVDPGLLFPKMEFEVRAGYSLGFRRLYSYIARDLCLVWRLHALLHAQVAAIHRASLCCLAAFFGPPALSGLRRRRAAGWFKSSGGNAVCSAARCTSGRGSTINNECSRQSSDTRRTEKGHSRENRCGDDNIRTRGSESDSSGACTRLADATARCGSEASVGGGHREATMCARGTRQHVSGGEGLDVESGGVSAFTVSESNLLRAYQPQSANWGPGLTSVPLHLKTLPRQLRTALLSDRHCERQQQQERYSSEPQPLQECAVPQHVTWHGERALQRRRQQRQAVQQHPTEEFNYVCVWGLGGLDFVTEGLLANDCCSGLRHIDFSESTCASPGAAVGEYSGAGCRGVFAFWHAFFGRLSAEVDAARVCLQQRHLRSPLSPEDSHGCSVDQKAGEEEQRGDAMTGTASSAVQKERLKLKRASADFIEDSGEGATSSPRETTAAAQSKCCTVPATQGGTPTVAAALHEGTAEESQETTGAAGECDAGQSATALLYDSVGALFSGSPVEALLEQGKLLQRLALLLSIHRTDEDFERHALQLLLGLSAAGPASIECMFLHAPLQERIRCLAEGLLIGSVARAERLQQQELQQSLAVATSRAAEKSSSSAAGLYFVAKAEVRQQIGRNESSIQGTEPCLKGSSDNRTSSGAISRRQHDTTYCWNSSSNPAQQEHITLRGTEGNVGDFRLRRSEYLLLRELLMLLRLWAGWAPSRTQDSRTRSSTEAAAAAVWENTLIGQDSACCALLLQAFTNGIFLFETAATREATVACSSGTGAMSGKALEAETPAPPTTSGEGSTQFVMSSDENRRESYAAAPADEDVLIAAVEAARALRVLEARGALPYTFASFYPSAVQLLHSFTRQLGKLQEQLFHVSRPSDGKSRDGPPSPAPQQSGVNGQQQEDSQRGDPRDLEPELQQQMQELQQQELGTQQHGDESEAAELLEFFLAQGTPLQVTGQQASVGAVATAEDIKSLGSSVDSGGNTGNITSKRNLHWSDRDIQRDVAFAWVFRGALVKELLRWGAVAAAKGTTFEDASADAHEFLLQVTPLVRAFPSLLGCRKQLELGCGLLDSFANAASVQVLQAATQLLLVASRKVARAVCSCDTTRSPTVGDYNRMPDAMVNKSVSTRESEFASLRQMGGGHSGDNGTSGRESSSAGVTTQSLAVQHAAVCCWIDLMEPLAETLVGPATDQSSARCGDAGSVDSAGTPQAEKSMPAEAGVAAGGGGDNRWRLERAELETRGASHSGGTDGSGVVDGRGKTCGGLLLRLMDRLKDTCSRNGGSSIATALTRYAVETGWTSLTSCCCPQCLPCLPHKDDVRNSCRDAFPRGENVCRPLRCSRWRGVLPATSECFAETEVLDRFSLLSAMQNSCSMPARGATFADIALQSTAYKPQDIELFLSEVSFLSTACNWVASSLHVMHHWRESRYSRGSGEPVRERASASNHVSCSEFSAQQQRERSAHDRGNCTPQTCIRRYKSSYQRFDESGSTSGDQCGRASASVSARGSSGHCGVFFSPEVVEQLADAAVGLASALRGALQCLFQELRWPQHRQSALRTATGTTRGVSASAMRTWPLECPSQQQQQGHPQHKVRQSRQQCDRGSRRHEPVSSGQHQATATSRPLILFEPLAQLALALQLLLHACGRFCAKVWSAAEEQRCLLAACSAAATPRTFLRALLMLYHSVSASSLVGTQKQWSVLKDQQHNAQPDEQSGTEFHPGAPSVWLKGAAQWFSMCCDFAVPAQHYTADLVAASATNTPQDATCVYKLLLEATTQSDAPLEQRQRINTAEATPGGTWPRVLCAVDLLDVLVNNAAKSQQDAVCVSTERAKTGQMYVRAAHSSRGTLFSEPLAVCPIDGIVGGGIWQCFCWDTALVAGHRFSRLDSATPLEDLTEALSLCRIVVWKPNLAQELQRYVPPSAVFAALVALYTEPHLTSTTSNSSDCSVRRLREAEATVVHPRGSPFSIYARPTVYDLFCRLLDKLLLQPLGKQLRDYAIRQQSEKRKEKQEEGVHVQGVQGVEGERQWGKEEDARRKGDGEQQREEAKYKQDKHQEQDRLLDADRLCLSTPMPCDYLDFSRSFLTVFCRACQAHCYASLEEGQSTTACVPELLSNLLRPHECFRWFPVCCNKAQDVLVECTARLQLISQSAADAADPLLSLLLWLLTSPAFPFECRRMLVRGEQTWLKVASQLFCFVCELDGLTSLRERHQLEYSTEVQPQRLQQHQPHAKPQQREQPQHVTQLAHQLQGDPRQEMERWQQPRGPQYGQKPKVSPSHVAQAASSTSEIFVPATSLERASYWGMQSPRGDVFWFRAPDSLYAALPGLWREDNEEILVGWSLYVRDRLAKGFLLSRWQPPCESKLEAPDIAPQSTQTSPLATSCFVALLPLHALALLVADEFSSMVVPSLPLLKRDKACGGTHEPAPQEGQVEKRQQHDTLAQEHCASRRRQQQKYSFERTDSAIVHQAKVNYAASTEQMQKHALPSSELRRGLSRAARESGLSTLGARHDDIDRRFAKLQHLMRAQGALKSSNGSEAAVAEVAKDIARIIYGSRAGAHVERSS